jgi:hypothetical protein
VGGGDEEVAVESLYSSFGNWDVTAEGVYFVDRSASAPRAWVVKFLAFDDRRVTEVAAVAGQGRRPVLSGPSFSVSSDGRLALMGQWREEHT